MEGIPQQREKPEWDLDAFKRAIAETGGLVIEDASAQNATDLDMQRFGQFPPTVLKAMELQALFADHYLKGPVIQGPFEAQGMEGDWDKRNWRQNLIGTFGEEARGLLETNRMRGNLLTPVLSQADRVIKRLHEAGLNSSEAVRVQEAAEAILAPAQPFETFASRYEHMPLNERVGIVRAVSEAARAYLDLVTARERELQQAA